mmetsp:Transcript_22182/g.61550  ORF Transcript_22182/g.61550 Transcript_22182/m.61550 type:complete len:370 (-) Transcript_22182:121-1230(-)
MFTLAKNFYKWVKEKREKNLTLVLLGLDNAGKTTLLHAIMDEVPEYVTPTYGFNKKTFGEGPYTINVFDLGGGRRIRSIWSKYLAEVHGAVFVLDAADFSRFDEAKEVLLETLSNPYLSSKPILIMANKQDLPTAADVPTIASALGLGSVRNNRYHILPCSAKTEEGGAPDKRVKEGIKWISSNIGPDYKQLQERVKKDTVVEQENASREMEEKKRRVAEMKAQRAREAAEAEVREQAEQGRPEAEGAPLMAHPAGAQGTSESVSPTEERHVPNKPSKGREAQRDQKQGGPEPLGRGPGGGREVFEPNKASEGRETPSSLEVSSLTAGGSGYGMESSPLGSKTGSLSQIPGSIPSPVKSGRAILPPVNG